MSSEKEVDLAFLKEFCHGDKKKMTQYIHTFLQEAPAQIEAIKKGSEAKDWSRVKMAAHALQPQAAFVGLIKLKKLLDEIESAATEHNPPEKIISTVTELETTMENGSNELVRTLVTLA